MGKDPETIEQEIEDTRGRMGNRVDALAAKADVKGRIGEAMVEKRDAVTGKLNQALSGSRARTPSREKAKATGRRVAGFAQENPLPVAFGAAAAGFLIGLLLPATQAEDRTLGEAADAVKSKATEGGEEALRQGQQI